MTKEECYEDFKAGWDGANESQRKGTLVNAGFDAFGQSTRSIDDIKRNGMITDPSKISEYANLNFESLPADMRERMVTAYYNENKE